MRFLIAIGLASFLSLSSFAQSSLPVDQNTIALWNFDTDTATNVVDSGPNSIHGTSVNTVLRNIPNVPDLNSARFFKDQTSFVSFGNLTQNSPLDLLSLPEWTIEFVTWWDRRPTGSRVVFDNGQVSVKMIDFKFAVTLNYNGTKIGVMTPDLTAGATPYRTAVVFKDSTLSILVNGKVKASTSVNLTSKSFKKRIYNQPIRVGGSPSQEVSNFEIGRSHACLTTNNGDLKCWGNNSFGQLGDGTTNFYFIPVNVEGIKNVSKISIGENFTCVLKEGIPYCWGQDDFYSLGTPYAGPMRTAPGIVPDVTNASDISTGRGHTCTLLNDQTVKCWGRNDLGQIGMGSYFPASSPLTVQIQDVKQLATGGDHVCAVKNDNTVWCWGNNSRGQLGQVRGVYQTSAVPMQVNIADVDKVTAGMNHSCALKFNGSMHCWGANDLGQLGNGTTVDSDSPVGVQNSALITKLDAGYGNHTCGSDSNSILYCWGQNDRSQVGLPNSQPFSSSPVQFNLARASQVSVGGRTNCFQNLDKSLYCFGSNSFGLLGDGSIFALTLFPSVVLATEQSHFPGYIDDIRISDIARAETHKPQLTWLLPVSPTNEVSPVISVLVASELPIDPISLKVSLNGSTISGLSVVADKIEGQISGSLKFGENTLLISIQDTSGNESEITYNLNFSSILNPNLPIKVATGGGTSCYLTGEGYVWCWGSNQSGQLGIENSKFSSTPIRHPYHKNIVEIALSRNTLCAKNSSGDVYCSGSNESGQLGVGADVAGTFLPRKLNFSLPVSKLISGDNAFCALHPNNSASCWGNNGFRKLNSFSQTNFPVLSFINVRDIALAKNHTCVVDLNNQMSCVGHNVVGMLGTGDTVDRIYLTPVQTGLTFNSVTASDYGTCGIGTDAKTYCWGFNTLKEIGVNSNDQFFKTPQEVTLSINQSQMYLGNRFSCSLDTDASVSCMGQNKHGEIGTGVLSKFELYHNISGHVFNALSVGGNTICGLTANQEVYCWGANSVGQAGNANGPFTSVPTKVVPHISQYGVLSNLTAGQANTCMKIDGNTHCWGNNEQDQLGVESGNFEELYPLKLLGLENVVQTSIGYGLLCHVSPERKVKCAGFNNVGQAGQHYTQPRISLAMEVPGPENIIQVEAGLDYSCALNDVGQVWCWGSDQYGQLGAGGGLVFYRPPGLAQINNVKKIAVAKRGYHTCALRFDNSVSCWGDNRNYQIETKPISSTVPYAMSKFGNDNLDISLASFTTCVLKMNGKVICIGSDSSGETGVSSNFNPKLVPVSLPKPVQSLQAGQKHVCVLDSENNVYCWGENEQGQIGIEGNRDSRFPVKVLSGVRELASGSEHSCAITLSNKLVCWGYNGNGQFGNGKNESSSVPTSADITKN